jgi:hypothetical protein
MEAEGSSSAKPVGRFHKFLVISSIPITLATAALCCRILWEENSLTFQDGPQMIGFSLAHGYFAMLFFAPLLSALWAFATLITLIVSAIRKRQASKWLASMFLATSFILGLLMLPPVFWQWLFIGHFAKSSQAAELMTYATGEGDLRTVRGYLSHGVPIESKNYEGATSLFQAAAVGNMQLLDLLASNGANLSAVNSYGDSPLAAAIKNHHDSAASFLKEHGAVLVKGTQAQRDAAIEAIVQRDIARMNHQ